MGYTNKETLKKLEVLVREFFKSNAKVDNIAYALTTTLGYPLLGENVHKHIAHSYGKHSDVITDFLDLRGDVVTRGNEIVEPKTYTSVITALKEIIIVQENLEDILKDCIMTAADNMDLSVEDMLRDFYKNNLVKYTKQANALYDKAVKFNEGGNLILFDEASENYIIVD